jgi:hypothetical protein
MRDVFDIVRKMTNTPMYCGVPVRDKAGSIITSVQGQLERWRQHFEEVLNIESSFPLDRERTLPLPELQISVRPPSKREIIQAIKGMKNGKAAGSDNISAEILKVDPNVAADMLLLLFQDIWKEEKFPKEWTEGIIVKIPKKGDLSDCNNWRGITLLIVISKNFNKIILESSWEASRMGSRWNKLASDPTDPA